MWEICFINLFRKELVQIRRPGPVKVIVHFPKNEKTKQELAARAAQVHAESVIRRIGELGCPNEQKSQLIAAIINTAEKETKNEVKNE